MPTREFLGRKPEVSLARAASFEFSLLTKAGLAFFREDSPRWTKRVPPSLCVRGHAPLRVVAMSRIPGLTSSMPASRHESHRIL